MQIDLKLLIMKYLEAPNLLGLSSLINKIELIIVVKIKKPCTMQGGDYYKWNYL